MNVIMSFIDYSMASLDEREVFSLNTSALECVYEQISQHPQVLGTVIIATCNRTEIYLNLEDEADANPFRLLCQAIDVEYDSYKHIHSTLKMDDAIIHLCKVASGAESQIWGDHQIISQVRDAIKKARELKKSDTILNVVFRTAIAAGKKVKTLIDFKVNDNSTAKRACNIIKSNGDIKKTLVVGNGVIGRLIAQELAESNIETTMTLRQYRHGENIVPVGVKTVNYGDRNQLIETVDCVVSATLSPHYTVHYEDVIKLKKLPKFFIDMAVPRDIEPKIGSIEGVELLNIDDISKETRDNKQKEQMKQIDEILKKYIDDFYSWYEFRANLMLNKEKGKNKEA